MRDAPTRVSFVAVRLAAPRYRHSSAACMCAATASATRREGGMYMFESSARHRGLIDAPPRTPPAATVEGPDPSTVRGAACRWPVVDHRGGIHAPNHQCETCKSYEPARGCGFRPASALPIDRYSDRLAEDAAVDLLGVKDVIYLLMLNGRSRHDALRALGEVDELVQLQVPRAASAGASGYAVNSFGVT